jgi:hypothetical protein
MSLLPVAQLWVELLADDAEAGSARAVAHDTLGAAAGLSTLRRLRLFELSGSTDEKGALEARLHRSTQFYNPHKERAVLRLRGDEPSPRRAGEHAVLVIERGATRRAAAERWWLHETGERVEVHEGVVWLLGFEEDGDVAARVRELVTVRDRAHGLLCNPHAQDAAIARDEAPLPWIERAAARLRRMP